MSAADKRTARNRAKRAGRDYPNLVDNMAVAAKKKGGAKKRATKKKGAAKKKGAPKRKRATKKAAAKRKKS